MKVLLLLAAAVLACTTVHAAVLPITVPAEDCDACKSWWNAAAAASAADPFLSESKSIALDVCGAVEAAHSRALCTAFVNLNWEQVLVTLAKLDAAAVCTYAELCPAESGAVAAANLRMVRLVASLPHLQEAVIELLGDEPNPLPDCDECVAAFDDAKTRIDDKAFINHAVYLGKKACKIVEMYEEECDQLVDQFTPLALQLIKSTDSKKLCGYLHICPATELLDQPRQACHACTATVRDVKQRIADASEAEVTSVGKRICNLVPEQFATCVRARPMLPTWLEKTRPRMVCHGAGLCSRPVRPAQPNLDYCEFCKGYLAQLKIEMQKPEKQQMARDIVAEACTLMPTWTDRCTELLQDYFMKAIKQLEKQDPHKVCMQIGVCTSKMLLAPPLLDTLRPLLRVVAAVPANTAKCVACQAGMAELEKELLDPAFRTKLLDTLQHLCDALGPLKSGCQSFITSSFPTVLDVLGTWPALTECEITGACNPQDDEMARAAGPVLFTTEPAAAKHALALLERVADSANSVECEACKVAVAELQQMVKDSGVVDQVKQAIVHICEMLGPMKDTCESMADSVLDAAISALLEQDPATICQLVGACTSSLSRATEPALPSLGHPVLGADDHDTLRAGAVTCEACVHAVTELQNLLYNRDVVRKIFEEIAALCSRIHTAEDACKDLVSQLVGAVMQLLMQTPPQPLCWLLSLCDMSEAAQPAALATLTPERLAPLPHEDFLATLQGSKNDMTCDACQALVQVVKSMLGDPSVAEKIKGIVHKACAVIPMREMCESLVDPLVDAAIDAVEGLDPRISCADIGICDASVDQQVIDGVLPMRPVTPASPLNSDIGCDSCKVAASELKDLLADEATHTEIKDFLKKACVVLKEQEKTCDALVGTFVDLTIQFVEDKSTAELCVMFKACKAADADADADASSSTVASTASMLIDLTGAAGDSTVCDVCKMVIGEAEALLKDPANVHKLHDYADLACNSCPYPDMCKSLLHEGIDMAVKEVLSMTAAEWCHYAHACTAATTPMAQQASSDEAALQGGLCDACQGGMKMLKTFLDNEGGMVEAVFLAVCNDMGSHKDECRDLVKHTFDDWLAWIDKADEHALCQDLGLCSAALDAWLRAAGDDACTVCKDTMDELKGYLKDPVFEQDLYDSAHAFCRTVGYAVTECDALAKVTLYPAIAAVKLTPSTALCVIARQCSI